MATNTTRTATTARSSTTTRATAFPAPAFTSSSPAFSLAKQWALEDGETSSPDQQQHEEDHRRMTYGHPSYTTPLRQSEDTRAYNNAKNGCPTCAAFMIGAHRSMLAEQAQAAAVSKPGGAPTRQAPAPRNQRPSVTRGKSPQQKSPEQLRRERAEADFRRRAAGDRGAAAVSPEPNEPVTAFLQRQAIARGAAEIAWQREEAATVQRGEVYGTQAPAPDGSVVFGTKASGQLKNQGKGPAGNDSVSPVVTVQPQSVGKRVLYNTQDAAALEAGVPEAAEERPSPTGDIVLDAGAFHQGGHQYPAGAPDRQVGVRPAPSGAEVAMTPAPTAIPRTNTTVGNSGSPNSGGYGQVQTTGSLVQRIATLEAKAAAEEAGLAAARATVQRIGEPLDVFIARQQEARGKAEIAVLTHGLPARKK
jgi:hypothetical protein